MMMIERGRACILCTSGAYSLKQGRASLVADLKSGMAAGPCQKVSWTPKSSSAHFWSACKWCTPVASTASRRDTTPSIRAGKSSVANLQGVFAERIETAYSGRFDRIAAGQYVIVERDCDLINALLMAGSSLARFWSTSKPHTLAALTVSRRGIMPSSSVTQMHGQRCARRGMPSRTRPTSWRT